MAWLGSVAVLAFVMAVTPGPNNVVFAAAGARHGYRRSLPLLGGMIGGFVLLIAATVAGVGALVQAVPGSRVALTVVASLYMVYLAVRLWRAAGRSGAGTDEGRLLTWWQMTLFQVINPKTWLAILAFVSGKLGGNEPGGTGSALWGTVVFLGVVWFSASLWTLFGSALRAAVGDRHGGRTMRIMALVALGTVPTFWW